MLSIHKYPLQIAAEQPVLMPDGSSVLDAQVQNGQIVLWAQVDTTRPIRSRWIYIHGTGHSLPADILSLAYIATVQAGRFVWHLFDGGWQS